MYRALNINKELLITHFICNLQGEYFESSYSIIGQYLLNTNENGIIYILQKFCNYKQGLNANTNSTFPSVSSLQASLSCKKQFTSGLGLGMDLVVGKVRLTYPING